MHSRSALVIARAGNARRLPELPWLASQYHVCVTDWILFGDDGWRDILADHAGLWTVFEHKLLTSAYLHRPCLVAVVSHPGGRTDDDAALAGQDEVRRLVERLHWYSLPATIMGFWTNPWWGLEHVIEPEAMEPDEQAQAVAWECVCCPMKEHDTRRHHKGSGGLGRRPCPLESNGGKPCSTT